MFRQMKTERVALLLHGLRSIYVADQEEFRQELIKQLEGELAARGVSLPESTGIQVSTKTLQIGENNGAA